MKTSLPKESEVQRQWHVVDAAGKPLGRLAVTITNLLRGRGKRIYTPHVDTGDFVVVVNAEKVKLTGSKETSKTYQRFSGFRGGLVVRDAAFIRARNPERMIQDAVHGMLPRNHMSREVFRRLKVYAGEAHPHAAQNPKAVELK